MNWTLLTVTVMGAITVTESLTMVVEPPSSSMLAVALADPALVYVCEPDT